MDITGVPQNAQSNNELINAARAADNLQAKRSGVSNELVRVPAVEQADLKRLDEKRLADMKRVIERNSFKDTYAVRDNSFTIFKDENGQYVTRFTDLRDGSVTYVPEKEVLGFGNTGGSSSYMEVQA